jgi:hypothetical protein
LRLGWTGPSALGTIRRFDPIIIVKAALLLETFQIIQHALLLAIDTVILIIVSIAGLSCCDFRRERDTRRLPSTGGVHGYQR